MNLKNGLRALEGTRKWAMETKIWQHKQEKKGVKYKK